MQINFTIDSNFSPRKFSLRQNSKCWVDVFRILLLSFFVSKRRHKKTKSWNIFSRYFFMCESVLFIYIVREEKQMFVSFTSFSTSFHLWIFERQHHMLFESIFLKWQTANCIYFRVIIFWHRKHMLKDWLMSTKIQNFLLIIENEKKKTLEVGK